MEDFNTSQIVSNELDAKFPSPITPVLNSIRKQDISSKSLGTINPSAPQYNFLGGSPLQDVKEKQSLTYQVPITEGYDLVAGEWMKKFPTYKQGRDNAEFAAQTQSTTDKWINGTLKALGKFNNAVIGGTAGIVYGVGQGIADQSWASVYDNDFSNWLNDLDQKMNYQLPNYYTKQAKEMGLVDQLTKDTSNFLADKVLGGLSFTAGAIVSEGIWAWATGGTSLATTGARWSTKLMGLTKIGSAVGKFSSLLKKGGLPTKYLLGNIPKNAGIIGGQIGEGISTLRFTMTSAGYEASVEALQYRKEAEENFYANFEKLNGRAPEAEDIAEFKANLDSASNSVFATNMALVGSSNLLAFGKVFNVGLPKIGIGGFLDKKLYGLGLDNLTKTITPSRLQKINRATLPYLRSMVEEGLYEEGFQSITSKTANKWIEHTYNPSVQMENFDMAGAIYENMAEQYGTKEGWVENGVGMIIGVLGEAGTKGRSADVKQKEEKFKQEESFNKTYTQKAVGEHMLMLGRMKSFSQEAEGHAKAGNITAEKIANDGVTHAYLNHKYQIGRDLNETVSDMKDSLDTLTTEQFVDMGIEESQIDQYKSDTLNEFKTAVKQFRQNRKYAEYVIGKNTIRDLAKVEGNQLEGLGVEVSNELLIQALTYNLSAGESANKVMSDIVRTVGEEVGADFTSSLKTIMSLSGQKVDTLKKVNSIRKQIPALEKERNALTKELLTLQNAPKETEGNREQGLRLGKVNERLLEVSSNIDSLNNQLTDLTKEINNNREFRQNVENLGQDLKTSGVGLLEDSITAEDLVNLEENIKKLEGLIDSYKITNPQKAEYLNEMLVEFKNANEIFQANQRTAIALSSGKLRIKHFNTWAQKKLQGKKTLDDFTSEWLTDLLNTYTKNKVSDMGKSLTQKQQIEDIIVTDEEWNSFVDNGKVSDKILNSLADKVANKEPLTEKENAIFIDKTSEIEEILKQTVQSTNPNQEKIDALLEEKRKLEEEVLLQNAGLKKASDLKEGDKIQSGGKTYTIKAVNQGIGKNIVDSIETEEGFTIQNPYLYGLSKTKDWNVKVEQPTTQSEIEAKKAEIEKIINSLPDNLLFITHITSEGNAINIFNSNLLMPAGVSSTTGIVKKEQLKQILFDLTEGKSTHRGYLDMFIGAIDRATLESNNGKTLQDKLENYLDDNFIEDVAKTQLPSELNIGYFSNGVLNTKYNKPQTTTQTESKQQKRIDEINKELEKLNQTQQQTPTPLNKTQLLRDRLDNMLKNSFNNITGIVGEDGQIAVVKPTQAEIEEYRELLSQPTEGLFIENKERLEELQKKLGQWRLLDSAIQDDNISIAELIEQLTQLEQQIEEEVTSTELTEEQIDSLNADIELQGEKYDNFELLQNTLGSATVRPNGDVLDANGNPIFYNFSHLKPSTFFKNIEGAIKITSKGKVKENATLDDVNNAPAGSIIERGGLIITVKDEAGTLEMRVDSFKANSQRLGMFITDTKSVKWSYKDIYYYNGVDFIKMPSDYLENIEPQESYNLKKGDILTLEVDENEYYTAELLKEYEKSKNKEEAEKKLRSQLKIYAVTKDGIKVATLKGLRGSTEDTEIFDIRNRAMQALLDGNTKVGISVEVSNIFMGSPSFTFTDGKIDNLNFTQKTTDIVLATGYVQDGELTLNKEFTEEVNKTFVGQVSKRNPNKKTPVIVFQKGAYKIAYPISVKKSKANKGNLIENLLNQNLTKPQLAIAINNLIQENKIKTEKVIAEEITDQKIEDLIQAFNNKDSFRTADEFADKAYKVENLQQDALINIDLENPDKAISDPKIRLDFSTIKYADKAQELVNSLSLNIEEINEKLNNQSIDLYQDFLDNEDKIKFLQGHEKYYSFMKNNPMTKDNDINTNIEILRKVLPMRTIYLNEKMRSPKVNITNIKQDLNKIDRLTKAVKAQKSVLNNGKKNVDKNCTS